MTSCNNSLHNALIFTVLILTVICSDALRFGISNRGIAHRQRNFILRHASVDVTIRDIKHALTSRPNDEPLLFNLGMLQLQQDNTLDALTVFYEAVKLNPTREASWYQIGSIRQSTGDIDAAIGAFKKAIEVTADEAIAIACYNNIVEMMLSSNRLEEAALLTNEAVNKYPQSVMSWTNMGIVLRENKSFDWARLCFENAVKCAEAQGRHEGGVAVAFNNLGSLCWQAGQVERACEMYSAALAADERDESSAYNLAVLLRDRGDLSSARGMFERCLAINPGNSNADFQLAALSSASGGPPAYEQCPPAYVSDLFDHYAQSGYDQHMLGGLQYRVPELLWDAYCGHVGQGRAGSPRVVVDLGVGTGLVGRRFREGLAEMTGGGDGDGVQFWGCDLSGEMVVKAYELTWGGSNSNSGVDAVSPPSGPSPSSPVYTDLAVADCADYLEARAQQDGGAASVDLVLAGDVLGYVGRLDRIFDSVRAVLAIGGVFVFSVEKLEQEQALTVGLGLGGDSSISTGADAVAGAGYALRASARFAHSAEYVKRTASLAGLAVAAVREVTDLRTEGGAPVPGYIVVLQRVAPEL